MQIRLFLDSPLNPENIIPLSESQSHYLQNVMRRKIGDELLVFNGSDGEFRAVITASSKKQVTVKIAELSRQQKFSPNLGLAFAPVKNVKSEYLATKATELGVKYIQPIITERTIVKKVNVVKIADNIIEAAEQCERMDLAEINQIMHLKEFLKSFDKEDILIFCDESGTGDTPLTLLPKIKLKQHQRVFALIGPEGGFSQRENQLIKQYDFVKTISLGDNILKVDTATISILSLMQHLLS